MIITDERIERPDELEPDEPAGLADDPVEASTAGVHESGSEEPSTSSPATAERRRRWPIVLCVVLAALGFAGTGYFGRAWFQQRSVNKQVAQVRATATGFVQALTNFDPATVDGDFARIQSYATGSFSTQAKQFFGSSIRQQLQTAGAASRGQVRELFVESLSGADATVFAVVDQTYLNDKVTSAQADTLRLELDMTDGATGWRIAAVTVLQSPAGFPATSATSGSGGTP